jgi:DNA repair exonuclease SbcCD ATPase subunit
VERKRNAYQDQQAEGLLSLDELHAKLLALEEARKTAQRELEALKGHEESMTELEADRDAILQYYEKTAPDALDSLTSEERQHFYALLRLECYLLPMVLESTWVGLSRRAISVCESGKPSPFSCRIILVRRA